MQSINCNLAVDLSQRVDDWSKLKNEGINYVIPRAWRSLGIFDVNAVDHVNMANEVGI